MSRAWRWSERAAAKIRAFEDAAEELHRSRRTAVERADERLGIVFKRQGSAHYFQRVNSAHLRFARARNAVCDRAKHLRHVFYVNFFSLCARCASERSRTQFLRERGGSRARVARSSLWMGGNKQKGMSLESASSQSPKSAILFSSGERTDPEIFAAHELKTVWKEWTTGNFTVSIRGIHGCGENLQKKINPSSHMFIEVHHVSSWLIIFYVYPPNSSQPESDRIFTNTDADQVVTRQHAKQSLTWKNFEHEYVKYFLKQPQLYFIAMHK